MSNELKVVDKEEPKRPADRPGGNGGGGNVGERLARLEEKVDHLATKTDIEALKTTFWRSAFLVVVSVAGLAFAIARFVPYG
ncbi:MAG: hypothetical protein ACR2PV_06225 [Gammaproteobacteria bacterium]